MRRVLVSALFLVFALSPPSWAVSFGVSMQGSSEVPAGDSNGVGFADLTLDGTTLRYSVIVFNIGAPTAMHIHPGKRGATGSPLIPFTTPFVRHEGCPSLGAPVCTERFVSVGEVQISSDDAAALTDRPADFYLNVHNEAYPSGAVRGQIQSASYLPIVGQTPGAAGTHWFTRFAALNRSMVDASEWMIEFLPQSPAGNTDRFIALQPLAAPLNLLSSTEFPVLNFSGIGSARVLSDQPLEVNASIYNGVGGARGDFGFSVHGRGIEDASRSGLLVDLTTSSAADIQARRGYRSNIGYFNPQLSSVDATFRAYGSNGAFLGERVVTIPPGAMMQPPVFDLIDSVAAGERVRDSFWVSWVATAPIFVYATVVNNDTGDSEIRD